MHKIGVIVYCAIYFGSGTPTPTSPSRNSDDRPGSAPLHDFDARSMTMSTKNIHFACVQADVYHFQKTNDRCWPASLNAVFYHEQCMFQLISRASKGAVIRKRSRSSSVAKLLLRNSAAAVVPSTGQAGDQGGDRRAYSWKRLGNC